MPRSRGHDASLQNINVGRRLFWYVMLRFEETPQSTTGLSNMPEGVDSFFSFHAEVHMLCTANGITHLLTAVLLPLHVLVCSAEVHSFCTANSMLELLIAEALPPYQKTRCQYLVCKC